MSSSLSDTVGTKPVLTAASLKNKIWRDLKKCAKRRGLSLPEEVPDDFDRTVRINVMNLAKQALALPALTVPVDDQSWAAGGVNGLSFDRLSKDESGENVIESDMHSIAVFLSLGDQEILVPIAADLDEDAANRIGMMIGAEIPNFVDIELFIEMASSFLSEEEREGLTEPVSVDITKELPSSEFDSSGLPTTTEFKCNASVISGSWREMLDLGKRARLPMSSAMFLRTPAAWDLLRAKLSGLPLMNLPAFPVDFANIFARSVRHDRVEMGLSRKLLANLITAKKEMLSTEGLDWFYATTDIIDTLGTPGAVPGLSVLLSLVRTERVDGFENEALEKHIPDDLFHWDNPSFRNIAVGVSLNPVQALMLSEVVKRSPNEFHDLQSERLVRWVPAGVMVVPNAHLSAARATINGRNSAAYDELREALAVSSS